MLYENTFRGTDAVRKLLSSLKETIFFPSFVYCHSTPELFKKHELFLLVANIDDVRRMKSEVQLEQKETYTDQRKKKKD